MLVSGPPRTALKRAAFCSPCCTRTHRGGFRGLVSATTSREGSNSSRSVEATKPGDRQNDVQRILTSDIVNVEQGSQAWFKLRENRLTASSFASAIGFFEKRDVLWEEKLKIRPRFKGNHATKWGIEHEQIAMETYRSATGLDVKTVGFAVYGGIDNPARSWLGASPDGVYSLKDGHLGLVEIKCPYNDGNPHKGKPPAKIPWYYVPQIQGQMEILNAESCDVCLWTLNGAHIIRMYRNKEYWQMMLPILQRFWFYHVNPALIALRKDKNANLDKWKPSITDIDTSEIRDWSKELVKKCASPILPEKPFLYFPPRDTDIKERVQFSQLYGDASRGDLLP